MNKPLTDIPSERAVLAGMCQYGSDAYVDVIDIIDEECFTSNYNKVCFACIKYCFDKEPVNKLDIASIHSAANNLGLTEIITDKAYSEHMYSLFNFGVDKDNSRKFAVKIKKLAIARKYRESLAEAQQKILDVDGSESISEILSIGEGVVLGFIASLGDTDNEPRLIGDGAEAYVHHLSLNPTDQIGIPTGFPRWDASIGGGLRPATVNFIAARAKCGKSTLSANMGYYIANNLKIPVLNLDTEMTYLDHVNKTLAMVTECYIEDVETGKFMNKPGFEKKIREAAKNLEQRKIPYYHKSISGMGFEEQIAVLKRWIIKTVGLKANGEANQCVIIYDYLKLMSGSGINNNMTEWQMLGFMMTALQGIAHKYNIPVLCFGQTNRSGIQDEDVGAAAGSDRITWFCSNFSIFKAKSEEEMVMDGAANGNRKLVTVICRHGAGLEFGNYINCHMRGSIAKITEGLTKFELLNQQPEQSERTNIR